MREREKGKGQNRLYSQGGWMDRGMDGGIDKVSPVSEEFDMAPHHSKRFQVAAHTSMCCTSRTGISDQCSNDQ